MRSSRVRLALAAALLTLGALVAGCGDREQTPRSGSASWPTARASPPRRTTGRSRAPSCRCCSAAARLAGKGPRAACAARRSPAAGRARRGLHRDGRLRPHDHRGAPARRDRSRRRGRGRHRRVGRRRPARARAALSRPCRSWSPARRCARRRAHDPGAERLPLQLRRRAGARPGSRPTPTGTLGWRSAAVVARTALDGWGAVGGVQCRVLCPRGQRAAHLDAGLRSRRPAAEAGPELRSTASPCSPCSLRDPAAFIRAYLARHPDAERSLAARALGLCAVPGPRLRGALARVARRRRAAVRYPRSRRRPPTRRTARPSQAHFRACRRGPCDQSPRARRTTPRWMRCCRRSRASTATLGADRGAAAHGTRLAPARNADGPGPPGRQPPGGRAGDARAARPAPSPGTPSFEPVRRIPAVDETLGGLFTASSSPTRALERVPPRHAAALGALSQVASGWIVQVNRVSCPAGARPPGRSPRRTSSVAPSSRATSAERAGPKPFLLPAARQPDDDESHAGGRSGERARIGGDEQRLGGDAHGALNGERRAGEQPARVAPAAIARRAREHEAAASRHRQPGAELDRRPVVLRARERDEHGPFGRPSDEDPDIAGRFGEDRPEASIAEQPPAAPRRAAGPCPAAAPGARCPPRRRRR